MNTRITYAHVAIDDHELVRRAVERDRTSGGDEGEVGRGQDSFLQEKKVGNIARSIADTIHKAVGSLLLAFGGLGSGEQVFGDRRLALVRIGGDPHEQVEARGVVAGAIIHELELKHKPQVKNIRWMQISYFVLTKKNAPKDFILTSIPSQVDNTQIC